MRGVMVADAGGEGVAGSAVEEGGEVRHHRRVRVHCGEGREIIVAPVAEDEAAGAEHGGRRWGTAAGRVKRGHVAR